MKRIFAFILSLIVLMSAFSVCSFAVDYDWLKNDMSFKNYKDLLYDIYYYNGKYCDECSWMGDCDSHHFAVTDINNDGIDELIVRFYPSTIAYQYMAVWTYDRNMGRVKMLGIYNVETSFYKTGYAKEGWSHNQGMSYPLWPYTIVSTDSDNGFTVDVQSYTSGESYYSEEFEALPDADNDGVIYIVEYNNDLNYIPLTYSEYRAFEDKYIPANMLIELGHVYQSVSIYSIEDVEADYGSDLPVNGTMKGDVDGNNKVTAADARSVLRFAAKLEELTEEQQNLADVDMSGRVTAADARKILRVAAKLDEFDTPEPDVTPDPPVTTVPDFVYDKESYYGLYVDDADSVLEYFNGSVYYSSESEYAGDFVFYTDGTVTDFCFLDIIPDWDLFPDWKNSEVAVNHSFGELRKDCPVVIQMTFHEFVPIHGISFTDANGIYHRYAIHQSAEDGSVYLTEF